jgi:hypothetical protein
MVPEEAMPGTNNDTAPQYDSFALLKVGHGPSAGGRHAA